MNFLDANYDITITTGDQGIEAAVVLKVAGETGTVRIPLTQTKNDAKPFQAKSNSEFTCETNDVGKIRRITIEHEGTDPNLVWHLKTVQIKKGDDTYKFVLNLL